MDTIAASVAKTSRALVVTAAQRNFGFGSEVAAEIMDRSFYDLDVPAQSLSPPFTLMPFGKGNEDFLIPNVDRITAAVRDLVA